jgi:hypothetical protein
MSADAKVWTDGDGREWQGNHDGLCAPDAVSHEAGQLGLVISGIEWCMGADMRWEIRVYPDGKTGLVGWVA